MTTKTKSLRVCSSVTDEMLILMLVDWLLLAS